MKTRPSDDTTEERKRPPDEYFPGLDCYAYEDSVGLCDSGMEKGFVLIAPENVRAVAKWLNQYAAWMESQ